MAAGSKKGERRGGRGKDAQNKIPAEIKGMIMGALNDVGGQKYLAEQAISNPVAFMTLLGKILPKDLTVDASIATSKYLDEIQEEDRAVYEAIMNDEPLPEKKTIN